MDYKWERIEVAQVRGREARKGMIWLTVAGNKKNLPSRMNISTDLCEWLGLDEGTRMTLYKDKETGRFLLRKEKTGLISLRKDRFGKVFYQSVNFCLNLNAPQNGMEFTAWVDEDEDGIVFEPAK